LISRRSKHKDERRRKFGEVKASKLISAPCLSFIELDAEIRRLHAELEEIRARAKRDLQSASSGSGRLTLAGPQNSNRASWFIRIYIYELGFKLFYPSISLDRSLPSKLNRRRNPSDIEMVNAYFTRPIRVVDSLLDGFLADPEFGAEPADQKSVCYNCRQCRDSCAGH
jgi:hypothetical protein